MIELTSSDIKNCPKILVVGVGGGGNNAVMRMQDLKSDKLDFAVFNTDLMVLDRCNVPIKLQLGERLTGGYGAGGDPTVGEASATESEESIQDILSGYNMVILTCGMGGGTGTGAAPIVAKLARDMGILVVGVVTMPFSFEGTPRILAAQKGIEHLRENTDTLLIIPNDKLISISDKPISLEDGFTMVDSVLKHTIESITNIVYNCGMINIDFNDLKTTLKDKGIGHLGMSIVDTGTPIIEAVKEAINSPLLETNIIGASNIMLNASGKMDINSLNEALTYVRETAGGNVNLIWGTVASSESINDDKIVITIIATGMPEAPTKEKTIKLPDPLPPLRPVAPSLIDAKIPTPPPVRDIKIPVFLQQSKK